MSNFVISDLSVFEDLNSTELKVAGAASAGAAAAANYNDAVAASGSTTNGSVYARSEGSYDSYYYGYDYYGGYYSSSYHRGPTASVDASDRYYYY